MEKDIGQILLLANRIPGGVSAPQPPPALDDETDPWAWLALLVFEPDPDDDPNRPVD